jgi:shikimate dehydrogenase
MEKYAVVGHPVKHSKSPWIHARFSRQLQERELPGYAYEAIEAPMDAFAATIQDFIAQGGRGCNITVPFKLEAFELATHRSDAAQRAGAVNALKFENGRIAAENFDGAGIVQDVQRNLGVQLVGKRVLLLGAGGAARGALQPLLQAKPSVLVMANRDVAKAKQLADNFSDLARVEACGYADLHNEAFDLIINATSASLVGACPAISAKQFAQHALAYDMMYGKGQTPFLALAANANARVADGAGMLVEQAALGCQWWRGYLPQTADTLAALKAL